MRHQKVRSRLNRSSTHRAAMLRNMAASLILSEKVFTTGPKAKALRPLVERMVTWAKEGSLASRRLAFAALGKKEAVHKLFTVYGPRFQERPGGYTRIVHDRRRMGDGAEMATLEFVDREIVIETQEEADKKKTRAQRARELRRELNKQRRRM